MKQTSQRNASLYTVHQLASRKDHKKQENNKRTFTSCLLCMPSEPMQVIILGRLMPPAKVNVGKKPETWTMSR